MSLIAFIADVHIGNHKRFGGPLIGGLNKRCRLVLECLELALDAAVAQGAKTVGVAGDFFDVAYPSPPVIAATMGKIQQFAGPRQQQWFDIAIGNHDRRSMTPYDHACAPLGMMANVGAYQHPVFQGNSEGDVLYIPYQTGHAKDWLPKVVRHMKKPRPVPVALVTHLENGS